MAIIITLKSTGPHFSKHFYYIDNLAYPFK
jgi:hypothetical protein